MMDYNVINAFSLKNVIGSTYADLYINYCSNDNESKVGHNSNKENATATLENVIEDNWKSPSDLLIGIIELKPPLTSKVTKSKTHDGILEIGDDVLQAEYQEFLNDLRKLLDENDNCWKFILKNEKEEIYKKVKAKYKDVFEAKSKVMTKEMTKFYENSLQKLEEHIKIEVCNVLISLHASMISVLNSQIKLKLQKEKRKLDIVLNAKYEEEVKKIEKYYSLLLNNEYERKESIINFAINERNHAISIFYEQILRERLTSTMYIMCTERKKCKIQKMLVEKIQNKEIIDIVEKIKAKLDMLRILKQKEFKISELNEEWEEKIKKILQIFFKFIIFALKLLPEQADFLLEFEKMVHLQLRDVMNSSLSKSSILLEENNLLTFYNMDLGPSFSTCDKQPFILDGDLSDTPRRIYGSRESLPSDVDLPLIRLQRQFFYAKCHGFESIKKYLQSQQCKCQTLLKTQSPISISTVESESIETNKSQSSDELFIFRDFHRLVDCPDRKCNNVLRRFSFPYLNSYLDYTEGNFNRVKTILGDSSKNQPKTIPLNAIDIALADLPFSDIEKLHHNIGTQYSSEEDLRLDYTCPCIQDVCYKKSNNGDENNSSSLSMEDILIARNKMMNEIAGKYPELMKILTHYDIFLK